jgi:hypothetical protein
MVHLCAGIERTGRTDRKAPGLLTFLAARRGGCYFDADRLLKKSLREASFFGIL